MSLEYGRQSIILFIFWGKSEPRHGFVEDISAVRHSADCEKTKQKNKNPVGWERKWVQRSVRKQLRHLELFVFLKIRISAFPRERNGRERNWMTDSYFAFSFRTCYCEAGVWATDPEFLNIGDGYLFYTVMTSLRAVLEKKSTIQWECNCAIKDENNSYKILITSLQALLYKMCENVNWATRV